MPSTKKPQSQPKPSKKAASRRSSRKELIRNAAREVKAEAERQKALPKTRAEKRQAVRSGRPKLPNVLLIAKRSVHLLWRHRWLFLGITLVYALLNVVLVRGFSNSSDLDTIKSLVSGQYHGSTGKLVSSLAVFGVLIISPNSNASTGSGPVYQTILIVITSLAVVWALRQTMAGHKVRIRDAFYLGMYPLVPVLLVTLLILIELIPLTIGLTIFSIVVGNGIASTWWQDVLWGIGCSAVAALTLYLLPSSMMALYIATIQDMTPMKAIRSARELVRYRRWPVLRKVLFLPFALLIITAIIVVPIAYLFLPATPWVVYVLEMLAIAVIHAYMYTLYRELLV